LFDCVVERNVVVRQLVEPLLWHVALGTLTVLSP
jgi:hypothetical protein